MDTPGVEIVRTAIDPLCDILPTAFATAIAETARMRHELDLGHARYNSWVADTIRALAHRELMKVCPIDGWKLGPNHHLRGQLLLTTGLMSLKFLHNSDSVVPPAGPNRARRAYYRNVPFEQTRAFDAETSQLLAIWHVADEEMSEVSIRVVRPITDKSSWMGPDTERDLDFFLPTDGGLSSLEFEQVDEGLQLDQPESEGSGDDVADDVI